MAHGQDYTKRQTGIINRYYDNRDTIMLQKLGEIVSDLYLCTDPKQADKLWTSAATALKNTAANGVRVAKLVSERNIQELAKVLAELQVPSRGQPQPAPRPTPGAAPVSAAPAPTPATPISASNIPHPTSPISSAPSPEDIKAALKAFKKRLKLTRLDEDSKLGRSPLTGAKQSQIVAITPPHQYPRAVWEELVRQGKLRSAGSGCYELLEP